MNKPCLLGEEFSRVSTWALESDYMGSNLIPATYLLAVRPWVSYSTCLCCSFLICKLVLLYVSNDVVVVRIKCFNPYRVPKRVAEIQQGLDE